MPFDGASFVSITGTDQSISGMSVDATDQVMEVAIVKVDGASNVSLEGLLVVVGAMLPPADGGPASAVFLAVGGAKMAGGRLTGNGDSGTVGVWFGWSGAIPADEVGPLGSHD